MSSTLIKICGIQSNEIAKQTALLGADFIGLIFQPSSRHHISLEKAAIISHIIKENGAIPVAVFVSQTAKEMQHICKLADVQVVQLHGDMPKSEHHLLPDNFQRIYVQFVNLDGSLEEDKTHGLDYCHPDRDFLSFDSSHGQGQVFDWMKFKHSIINAHNYRWFLAGGLNPENIISAINTLHPTGVDVSSGVENEKGKKDIALIQQFIESVRKISI